MSKLIKKLIIFILLSLSIFIVFLIWPKISILLSFILKVFLPFIIAFIIAYILQPIVCFTQKYIKNRTYAVLLTLIFLSLIMYLILKLTIPFFIKETKELIDNYEEIIESLEKIINDFATRFSFLPIDYQPTFDNIKQMIGEYISKIQLGPEKIISKIFSYISVIVIIPMTLIYFLIDYEKIVSKLRNYLIAKNKVHLKEYLGELNQSISKFLKTTFSIMIIMMIISSLVFWIAGLDYPLFFGAIVAITNIIPYIGPFLGGVLPVGYALIESTSQAFLILGIVIIVQFFESEILSPYLHSKNSEVHPILVIFSVILFGHLFGLIGMIIAVPIISIIKITLKYYPITLNKETNIIT